MMKGTLNTWKTTLLQGSEIFAKRQMKSERTKTTSRHTTPLVVFCHRRKTDVSKCFSWHMYNWCTEYNSYTEFRIAISLILFSKSSHFSRYTSQVAPLIKPTTAQFVTFPRSMDAVRTLLKVQQPQSAEKHLILLLALLRQELNAFKDRK